ncbi:hypothetical protein ACFTZF_43825 [Streptomyces mirabilis]
MRCTCRCPCKKPFRLDDLRHVKLAARLASNPFFDRASIDWTYSRTVFAGHGLLLIADRPAPHAN